MKKNLLMTAVCAVLAFGLFSCGDKGATTKTQVCNEKGWVLESGEISPAYELQSGESVSDLMDYLYACETDDVVTFGANGSETITTNVICEEGLQDASVAALWHFDNDLVPTTIFMQLPFFYNEEGTSYDEELENCHLISVNDESMVLRYTFNDGNKTYTFKMNCVPASKSARN